MLEEIRKLDDTATLYRDNRTGIAFVRDSVRGCSWSVHPSISTSGSVNGMRKLGYWEKEDKVVRCHGAYINTSHVVLDNEYYRALVVTFRRIACVVFHRGVTRCGAVVSCQKFLGIVVRQWFVGGFLGSESVALGRQRHAELGALSLF